jgi:hypothetical protein
MLPISRRGAQLASSIAKAKPSSLESTLVNSSRRLYVPSSGSDLKTLGVQAALRTTTPSIKGLSFDKVQRLYATQAGSIQVSVRDALNAAMEEEMERDSTIFLLGEEVAMYNGAYKVLYCSLLKNYLH